MVRSGHRMHDVVIFPFFHIGPQTIWQLNNECVYGSTGDLKGAELHIPGYGIVVPNLRLASFCSRVKKRDCSS